MVSAQKILGLINDSNIIVSKHDFKVGSASLDVHLGNKINTYSTTSYTLGDYLPSEDFKQTEFSEHLLKPKESVIVSIEEKFHFPNHITGILLPRGSLTKIGLSFPSNFINAGYKGHMSLLLTNHSMMDINIVPDILIGQVVFFNLHEDSENPYNKDNKYYNEISDKSKLDLDSELEEIYKKAFPSLYK